MAEAPRGGAENLNRGVAMRRSIFNALAVAAGVVLLAAIGVSAHGQLPSGLSKIGVHSQSGLLNAIETEVASEARDADETEAQPAETSEVDNDNEAADNDEQGEDNDDQGDNNDQEGTNTGGTSSGGDDGGGDSSESGD